MCPFLTIRGILNIHIHICFCWFAVNIGVASFLVSYKISDESLSFPAATEGTNAIIYWYWNCMYWVLFNSIIIPGIPFKKKYTEL